MLRTVCLVLAFVLSASPVAAKTGLRAVAEEAKKPPAQQKVVGQQEPSQTKHKRPAPIAEPAGVRSAPVGYGYGYGGAGGTISGRYNPPPSGISSMGIIDPEAVPSPPRTRWRFGAVMSGGGLAADSFGKLASGGLLVGLSSGLVSLDVRGRYTRGEFAGGIEQAFANLQGISADAVARIRVSEEFAPVDVNFMLMARLGRYDWDFRNPVQVAEQGGIHTYDRDAIRYRAFMAGLGIVPLRGWEWSLQFTAAGGHQRFQAETQAGFANDLFEDGPVVELLAEVVYSPF